MLVKIDLTDTSGYSPSVGDKVTFEAKNMIGSATNPGRVITTAPVNVDLVNGIGEVELEPGPHLLVVKARNYRDAAPVTFAVPEEPEEMTLRELLEGRFEYDPIVVQEAQQYMIKSREYSQASEASATRAETTVGNAEAVLAAKTAAEGFRDEADDSATNASVSASASAASASDSAAARDAAVVAQAGSESAKDTAVAAQDAAAASADNATAQAERSETAADTSRGYNDTAWTARQDSRSARDEAVAAKDGAIVAKDSAQASATAAQGSAAAAAQSEGVAATAAKDAADGVRSELSSLVSDASGHADSAAGSAAAAAQSAQDAASVVSDGVPDASTSMRGKVKLAGDLSGTADAPTVPGLAGKADTSHTHSVADVTGLQSALDGKVSTTSIGNRLHGTSSGGNQTLVQYASGATPLTVPYRESGGTLRVGEPTDGDHATTKNYVDAVKTTADAALPASKIQIVTALPDDPLDGTIYLVTEA